MEAVISHEWVNRLDPRLRGTLRFIIVFLKVHVQLDESTPRYLSPRSV